MEVAMPSKVTVAQLKASIATDPDALASDMLPPGSFARFAYDSKPYPVIKMAYSPASADKAECEKWGLTSAEWVEEMAAARIAMAHDMKLDLIQEGFF
jgi:hypothetical protein